MTRLTRTGLWLIPWLPGAIVFILARAFIWPNQYLVGDGPYTTAQFVWNIFYNLLLWPSFAIGVVLLVIAGVRRLVRLRRRSA
jgi:hypothetical protein